MTRSRRIAAVAALAAAPSLAFADCAAEIDALTGAEGHAAILDSLDDRARAVFEREIGAARSLAALERDRACRDVLGGAASLLADPRLADIIPGYGAPKRPAGYGLDPAPQDQPDGTKLEAAPAT